MNRRTFLQRSAISTALLTLPSIARAADCIIQWSGYEYLQMPATASGLPSSFTQFWFEFTLNPTTLDNSCVNLLSICDIIAPTEPNYQGRELDIIQANDYQSITGGPGLQVLVSNPYSEFGYTTFAVDSQCIMLPGNHRYKGVIDAASNAATFWIDGVLTPTLRFPHAPGTGGGYITLEGPQRVITLAGAPPQSDIVGYNYSGTMFHPILSANGHGIIFRPENVPGGGIQCQLKAEVPVYTYPGEVLIAEATLVGAVGTSNRKLPR